VLYAVRAGLDDMASHSKPVSEDLTARGRHAVLIAVPVNATFAAAQGVVGLVGHSGLGAHLTFVLQS